MGAGRACSTQCSRGTTQGRESPGRLCRAVRRIAADIRLGAIVLDAAQGLGLASICEARASACVSIYSRTFVNFPFRTVMSKTQ